ncbi:MAG: hypothetical protein ACPHK8_00255 [Thermoplasmatota archaeon]
MELVATLDADPRHTAALCWHNGKLYTGGQGKQVVEWVDLQESRRFAEHGASVNRIEPVEGGFVTCSSDHTVRRWTWAGEELWQIAGDNVRVVQGGLLVVKPNGRLIRTDLEGQELEAYPKTDKICDLLWDDGPVLATKSGLWRDGALLWDAEWVTQLGQHPEGWFAAQHEGSMRVYDSAWNLLREEPAPGAFLQYHNGTPCFVSDGSIHYGADSFDVGLKGVYGCCIAGGLLANAAADGNVRVFKLTR